jgi:uncharacterized protein YegL
MFQSFHFRSRAFTFLSGLPFVPVHVLHLLRVLLVTGTSPDASAGDSMLSRRKGKKKGSMSGAVASSDFGTRLASLDLLAQLCRGVEPVDAANHVTVNSLFPLLWASISEDFRTRTHVINTLVT